SSAVSLRTGLQPCPAPSPRALGAGRDWRDSRIPGSRRRGAPSSPTLRGGLPRRPHRRPDETPASDSVANLARPKLPTQQAPRRSGVHLVPRNDRREVTMLVVRKTIAGASRRAIAILKRCKIVVPNTMAPRHPGGASDYTAYPTSAGARVAQR